MSKFSKYFMMKEEDVIDYLKEKTTIFDGSSNLSCKEIGDGNLNYVYHVSDRHSGNSVIVKQAGPTARISEDLKLSTNRIKIESNVLILHKKLAKDHVPNVYLYDDIMSCFVMEDLSDHKILREALLEFETFPHLADHISSFMVNTLMPTTDLVMNHKDKKLHVKEYINPELCEITEDLVYTEPYNDYNNRNKLFAPNKQWIEHNIYHDDLLRLEAAKLKFEFMNHSQALIHGDLHTGSLFVTEESTKVIDPEFAFYGPIGYDIGNIIANFTFALIHGETHKKESFVNWISLTLQETVDLFCKKFHQYCDKHIKELMAREPGFTEWYLNNILRDTAGVAGLELIRRIVGLAKVKDITRIEHMESRIRAEIICLTLAKQFIKERNSFKTGKDYLKAIKNTLKNN